MKQWRYLLLVSLQSQLYHWNATFVKLPFKEISDYWHKVLASEGYAVSDGIRTRLKGRKCNLQGYISFSWHFALSVFPFLFWISKALGFMIKSSFQNGRRHITSSKNEVSRDLVVNVKSKKKQALLVGACSYVIFMWLHLLYKLGNCL